MRYLMHVCIIFETKNNADCVRLKTGIMCDTHINYDKVR